MAHITVQKWIDGGVLMGRVRAELALLEKGVLASDSHRAPFRLVFTATLASRWMAGLFPKRTGRVD
jgi:hypothetical protein